MNVLLSALITPAGRPARLVLLWVGGAYDLIVSVRLLDELERALRRAGFARYLVALAAAAGATALVSGDIHVTSVLHPAVRTISLRQAVELLEAAE